MVDALRQTKLEHLCLKSPLQEVLNLQSKHVIETHAVLIKHTNANETANEGVTLEKTLGVLLVEGEQLTRMALVDIPLCSRRRFSSTNLESWDWFAYRAARRILDRVSWTRHTSRLLRRPYSPASCLVWVA